MIRIEANAKPYRLQGGPKNKPNRFYLRDAMLARVLATGLRLSVSRFVTRRYCVKMAKCRITKLTTKRLPGDFSFLIGSVEKGLIFGAPCNYER